MAKIVEAIANTSTESPDKDGGMVETKLYYAEKVKTMKDLDTQIVKILCASKEENVDKQVIKEIAKSDKAIMKFERTLLKPCPSSNESSQRLGLESTRVAISNNSSALT